MALERMKHYMAHVGFCTVLVIACAALQYQVIQRVEFRLLNYVIPFFVGSGFGILIAYMRLLQRKYKEEKEIVLQKNKQIHSYLGTIVHDLRSPVSAISSLTELILDEKEKLNTEQKEYIELINTSASCILENIALILDNTKFEKGISPDRLELGNPYYTINSTIDKHLTLAIKKSISIQRLIEKNLPQITYDKDILDRVLSNIVSNAIKYSPPNTQIKIYTELFSNRLDLVVKDEGLGLSEEDMIHIFKEFHKLSSTPTGGEFSSGLGLSVAKKLIEQIGGEILVESAGKNQGSTFRIAFKIEDKAMPEPSVPQPDR